MELDFDPNIESDFGEYAAKTKTLREKDDFCWAWLMNAAKSNHNQAALKTLKLAKEFFEDA